MVIKYGKIITCDTNSVQLIHCLLSMIISIDGGTPGEVTLSGSALLANPAEVGALFRTVLI